MIAMLSYALCALALVTPLIGAATAGHGSRGFHARGHHDLSKRVEGNVELWKRFSQSKWTFYDVGLGACGKHNVASDFIVALNSAQFGGGYPGPNCFKFITMRYKGKTARAQIMDECPGCPYGGLDLSRGLFGFFDSFDLGIIYGSWTFGDDGGDDGDDNKPTPKPTSTRTRPRPTSTRAPLKLTPTVSIGLSIDTEPTTTSSTVLSTAKSSTTSTGDYSIGTPSGLTVPVATNVPDTDDDADNVSNCNEALVGMGSLAIAASGAD